VTRQKLKHGSVEWGKRLWNRAFFNDEPFEYILAVTAVDNAIDARSDRMLRGREGTSNGIGFVISVVA
jgi:hypothetical protein